MKRKKRTKFLSSKDLVISELYMFRRRRDVSFDIIHDGKLKHNQSFWDKPMVYLKLTEDTSMGFIFKTHDFLVEGKKLSVTTGQVKWLKKMRYA